MTPSLTVADFAPLWPAIILSVGAMVLVLSEVFLSGGSRAYQVALSVVATILAGGVALASAFDPAHRVFNGFGVLDPFSCSVTVVVCVGLLLTVLLSGDFLRERDAERGEFYGLLLFSAAGMSLLAMSDELITLFISLEILSVATYALTAFLRKGPRPAEAAFKYFILGAFSAALLIYGTALLYGATGSTKLPEIASALPSAIASSPGLTYAGMALIAAGLCFKVAAVPFHMWTPDVYEGAPTPVTALMSAGVKAAAFAALVRVFMELGRAADPTLMLALFGGLAFLTMVIGNLLAIPQRNVKRMLAYSSVAHAGYVLLGVAALFAWKTQRGDVTLLGASGLVNASSGTVLQGEVLKAIVFYLLAYTVTVVGAFGLVCALERRDEAGRSSAWDLDDFAGLATRKPGWAFAMAVFMLSLGGIPPTVGFMAKLMIFRSAVDAGLIGLAIVGVLSSLAGVYYYLRVVVYMYMRPASDEATEVPRKGWSTELALWGASVATLAFGIIPGFVTGWISSASKLFLR